MLFRHLSFRSITYISYCYPNICLADPSHKLFRSTMKLFSFISCLQPESVPSDRSIDAAARTDGSININYGPSDAFAPLDLDIVCEKLANNYSLPVVEENNDDLLQLEKRGGAATFINRILSREEARGYSSRIYYRAPAMGRIPFNWEAEPGKPKKELVDDKSIIPPLSPPPILWGKSEGNSSCFLPGGRARVGLLHKIHHYFRPPKDFCERT